MPARDISIRTAESEAVFDYYREALVVSTAMKDFLIHATSRFAVAARFFAWGLVPSLETEQTVIVATKTGGGQ